MILLKFLKPGFVALIAAGFVIAVTSGTASAITGEPLPFDQFTVVDGEITASCGNWVNDNGDPLDVTCKEPTISDGMMQREVTVSSPDPAYNGTYVQFIMVESGASGDAAATAFSTERGSLYFTNEDFIKMNNRGQGIASKQTILDSSFDNATNVEDRFSVESVYKTGWAQGNSGTLDPWLDLAQHVSQIQYDDTMAAATSAFELSNNDISIKSVGPGLDNTQVSIDQRVLMQDDKNANDDAIQKFKHVRLSGLFNDQATGQVLSPATDDQWVDCTGGPCVLTPVQTCTIGPLCLLIPGNPAVIINENPLLAGGTNGGVIDWGMYDEIAATWVGVEAVNPSAASISRTFGMTKYENLSKSINNLTELVTFTNPEAGNGGWDYIVHQVDGVYVPLFGTAEAMADVMPVTMTDFTVMNPRSLLGPLNLDYIANSDPTLPTATVGLTITPSDYNQWTVTNGQFTASCPGFADSCAAVAVNEGGFFQRWIVVSGEQYLQTIIVDDAGKIGTLDPNAANYAANSLAFVNETFVKQGAGNGLAANMHIAERGSDTAYLTAPTSVDIPQSAGDFTNDVVLNLGWANRGSIFVARDMNGDNIIDPGEGIVEPHAVISIAQGIVVEDNSQADAVSMEGLFTLERGATRADKRITIANRIGTQIAFINPIEFNSVTVSGAYQRTARADIADPFMLPGNSTDLAWSAGDALQATWLAGQYGTNPLVPATEFGTTSFTNRTTGERISYTDVENLPVTPNNWVIDPFLAEPTYP